MEEDYGCHEGCLTEPSAPEIDWIRAGINESPRERERTVRQIEENIDFLRKELSKRDEEAGKLRAEIVHLRSSVMVLSGQVDHVVSLVRKAEFWSNEPGSEEQRQNLRLLLQALLQIKLEG